MTRRRYRISFVKTETMRFTGHLDLQRAWDRMLRRAGLPVSFSSGFHPRPKIQIGAALPLGITGENELVDIETDAACDPAETARLLNEHAPPGIRIVNVNARREGSPGLEKLIIAGDYSAEPLAGTWPEDLLQRIARMLACDSLPRERRGKTYDLRPRILSLALKGKELRMRLSLTPQATGRPDEVLAELGMKEIAAAVKRDRLILRETDRNG